ncbi:cytochrome c oxidase subunit 7C, mitochondrial-like [Elephas maximus indicus]|uniref:cytochrome c oxidase subunit 7C, mitochondrial-like n=1 Tax=Elephas maximus indicus TaxID=99487 RepID=UPI002116EC7A|nr:cytochrome c oxidase subunit 7C, mitochondrial-like [Elephas maximus indicus]
MVTKATVGTAISSVPGLCTFCRASSSAVLGPRIHEFSTSVVPRSHYKKGPGKDLLFSVENKCCLLIIMILYFESGFAACFFILRHQPLKK